MAIYQGSVCLTQGKTGKSAYDYAVEGGYEGTEAEFEALCASIATHKHSGSDITSGIVGIGVGGTGASDAATARANLGAASSEHTHVANLLVYNNNEMDFVSGFAGGSMNVNYRGATESITDYIFYDGRTNKIVSLSELARKSDITYGTTDLTAGTSSLATGKLYFVYE